MEAATIDTGEFGRGLRDVPRKEATLIVVSSAELAGPGPDDDECLARLPCPERAGEGGFAWQDGAPHVAQVATIVELDRDTQVVVRCSLVLAQVGRQLIDQPLPAQPGAGRHGDADILVQDSSVMAGLTADGVGPAMVAAAAKDLGRTDEATAAYEDALALTTNEAERRFLERRLTEGRG